MSFTNGDPAWGVVIVTRGGEGAAEGLLERLDELLGARRDVRLCVVDTSPEPDEDTPLLQLLPSALPDQVLYHWLPADAETFNWAHSANMGLRLLSQGPVSAPSYVLFIHDDVLPPKGGAGAFLGLLGAALDASGVGLAVPSLSGDCGCPPQGLELPSDIPCLDVCEFVSSCALAVKMSTAGHIAQDYALFDEELSGYDWHGPLLMARLAGIWLRTVLVPGARLAHIGGGTYDREAVDDKMRLNGSKFAEKSKCGWEYGLRPDRPRIHAKDAAAGSDAAEISESLCFVIDSNAGAEKVRLCFAAQDTSVKECVVVDTDPSASRFDLTGQSALPYSAQARYFAAWDTDPLRQAIGSAATGSVRCIDLRDGHSLPPADFSGKRLRIGAHYDLPSRMKTLEVGMWEGVGLGDTLMLTPALREFKRQYPKVKVRVHHCWEAATVYQGNPDVDEVIISRDVLPPLTMFNAGLGAGAEWTIRRMFRNLGVAPEGVTEETADLKWGSLDRSLRYEFLPGEQALAASHLLLGFKARLPRKPKLAGLQMHGGWKTKNWAYSEMFVARLLEEGYQVVLFGTEPKRTPIIASHPDVFTLNGLSIRQAIAVISLLDVMVTFDSGLGYAASAVGTPCVSLWGPHNPRGLMLDTGKSGVATGSPNQTALRVLTPDMCQAKHGFSCRSGDQQTGGQYCPLRGVTETGADCLDGISTCNVLDEVIILPKWGVALTERYIK